MLVDSKPAPDVNVPPVYTSEQRRLLQLFYPHMLERLDKLAGGGRLVHYCSADAAMGILTDSEVWLRNTTCMNDFTEVEHGLQALSDAYHSPAGQRFRAALNAAHADVADEIVKTFDQHQDNLRFNSYLICLSEHATSEDVLGRLSMWRAYGRESGIALVLRNEPFRMNTNVLATYSSPVRYATKADLEQDFETLAIATESETAFLSQLGREVVGGNLFNLLKWAALSIKHPGFLEELEWRVVHNPALETSDVVLPDVKSVRGVPQTIYRLPLRQFPDAGFSTAVPDIIDRVIIGPTQYPLALQSAFVELLRRAGVPEPHKRVVVSDIPLR